MCAVLLLIQLKYGVFGALRRTRKLPVSRQTNLTPQQGTQIKDYVPDHCCVRARVATDPARVKRTQQALLLLFVWLSNKIVRACVVANPLVHQHCCERVAYFCPRLVIKQLSILRVLYAIQASPIFVGEAVLPPGVVP